MTKWEAACATVDPWSLTMLGRYEETLTAEYKARWEAAQRAYAEADKARWEAAQRAYAEAEKRVKRGK